MTAIGISGLGLTGVIRMSWVHDHLAHVVDHSHTDETTGTWTGLACPAHGLSLGTDVDNALLRHLAARGQIADLTWEAPDDITAGHGQAFQAAIRAYNAADTRRAEQLCPATGPDASGPPAGPRPNAATAIPRTSPTPSASKNRISRNGTQLRKLKGSGLAAQLPGRVKSQG